MGSSRTACLSAVVTRCPHGHVGPGGRSMSGAGRTLARTSPGELQAHGSGSTTFCTEMKCCNVTAVARPVRGLRAREPAWVDPDREMMLDGWSPGDTVKRAPSPNPRPVKIHCSAPVSRAEGVSNKPDWMSWPWSRVSKGRHEAMDKDNGCVHLQHQPPRGLHFQLAAPLGSASCSYTWGSSRRGPTCCSQYTHM